MILAALSPIFVPLWCVITGLFCIRIGRQSESARVGWFFFLVIGLLPIGTLFALIGSIIPVVVVAAIAVLVITLMFLDWYGERAS
ncbi:hypothetical protein ACH4PW_36610 [Streptomyces sp. NPDC017082]|uniref:hypothetical protein n=1 Tax=Streptomyces sp. NPDC017082 TaxID=3364974 RepID=UPI0037BD6971